MTTFLKISILLSVIFINCQNSSEEKKYQLWYNHPARQWTEALPVGNGRLGAMVFGKIGQERIQLNEESLWAGCKINNNNPASIKHLKEIRNLILNDNNDIAAERMDKYMLGTPPRIRSYQTLGDLLMTFPDSLGITEYRRGLDLNTGIAWVHYQTDAAEYKREVFVSGPDDVVVVRLTCNKKARLDVLIKLTRSQDAVVSTPDNHQILMDGQIIDQPDSLRGPGGAHMKFAAKLIVRNEGGEVTAEKESILIEDADALTILLTAATDYQRSKLDLDRSIQPDERCSRILETTAKKNFGAIKKEHVEEHQNIFNRVEIDLGRGPAEALATDARLQAVQEGMEDPALIALYFQYGRYLLMGSSRYPGVLPANLQGIWNERFNAPWNSDFHTNINLQMNYWPAEVCNLSETVMPLTDFFAELRVPGRVTAREMYGAGGWTMHHLTDPFGRTGIMDGTRSGTFPLGAAWMCLSFWRHYEFSLDRLYLKTKAYPIMKEAALFILDFLIHDREGYLVTVPSSSPENTFILPGSSKKCRVTYASTMDIQIITEFFNSCIDAAEILDDDPDFVIKLKNTLKKLPPVQIGKDGTVREWIKDYEEAEPGHRHMSHLFGLHPGTQITPATPELFEAAKRTIARRLQHGGGRTGWSRAWIINFYARLLDGEQAYQHILAILRKSTLPNLFDNHPPFQIDGNFGGAAGIAEMLLQSHNGEIHVLPALPGAWPNGSVTGLRARGNFQVDIRWQNHALTSLVITSYSDNECRIRYREKTVDAPCKKGDVLRFTGELD